MRVPAWWRCEQLQLASKNKNKYNYLKQCSVLHSTALRRQDCAFEKIKKSSVTVEIRTPLAVNRLEIIVLQYVN